MLRASRLSDRLMQHNRFDDLIADGVHRTERRHRFLRDERNLCASNRAHLFAVRVELGEIDDLAVSVLGFAVEQNLAMDDLAGRLDDTQHRFHRNTLAAATFAHDAKDLTRVHVKGHAVNRFDDAFVHHKVRFQIAHGEQRLNWSVHLFSL